MKMASILEGVLESALWNPQNLADVKQIAGQSHWCLELPG
jgi:hypothetical protein